MGCKLSEFDQPVWLHSCREPVQSHVLMQDRTVDLAVIGGGYTGCSAALTAAEAGASVCLLEAQEIGHGGSGRNVGLANAGLWLPQAEIRAHLGVRAGDRLIELLAAAPDQVFGLIETHGIECDPVRNGTLHCAHSAAGYRDLETRHAQLHEAGAPVRLLSADQTRKSTGSAAFHGALFDPRAGTIQPLGYVRGLARAAAAAGAHICTQSPVETLRHDGSAWVLETPQATVRAQYVLQATNAYHRNLPGSAPAYVPVSYFQYATNPLPDALREGILPQGEGCWDTDVIMTSFRMDPDGRFILGAMGDLTQPGGVAHKGWIKRKLASLYPELADQPLTLGWQGQIAMTSDHIPKITRIGPNALSVHGFSGRGIGPGTVFGRLSADCLLNDAPERLPVPGVEDYAESWTGLRGVFFETGAVLTHFLRERF